MILNFRNIQRHIRVLRWRVYFTGVSSLLIGVAGKLLTFGGMRVKFQHWYLKYANNIFEKKFGVSINDNASIPEDIPTELRAHAVEYTVSPQYRVAAILEDLDLEPDVYTFVDFGSGEGLVLCVASEFSFKNIVGIEISSSLNGVAQKNIRNYRGNKRCSDIESICADATLHEINEERILVYLFNPFSKKILNQILKNLEKALLVDVREILVIYYNPIHRELLDQSSVFEERFVSGVDASMWVVYEAHTQIRSG